MASMRSEEHLDKEQPKEEMPINENCQEPSENVDTNGANLAKSTEGMDKESTNLPFSRRHRNRKLPAELNHQIYYCLNLATRRKFICGLGWGFYSMFRQILLMKSKRLRNPQGNAWRFNENVTILEDGLIAKKNAYGTQYFFADKGFPISVAKCRMDKFPGTICYYFEVKILELESTHWCWVGITDGEIPYGKGIGWSPNYCAIAIRIPYLNYYQICLAGQREEFKFPEGVIRPEQKDNGNVVGCGILMYPDDKLRIFFTVNGILIVGRYPLYPTVDHLIPTVSLWDEMSVVANFGDDPAKPFKYDIEKCPGMGLEWI